MKVGSSPTKSIRFKLQLSFTIAFFVLLGLMAVVYERAFDRVLGQEDQLLARSNAATILFRLDQGQALSLEDDMVLEKCEWELTDSQGQVITRSRRWHQLPPVSWPSAGITSRQAVNGQHLALSVMSWQTRNGLRQGTIRLALDRTHERELVVNLRKTFLLTLFLATLAASGIGYRISKAGLEPLRQITKQARKIDYENIHERLEPGRFPAELQDLVDTFNGALERLQKAFNRLNQLGSELAHELRTPLQNLRSEVETLILRPPTGGNIQDALGSVIEECDRMASLIEQILFLARSENPGAAIDAHMMDVHGFLEKISDPYEALADDKAIAIQITAPQALSFYADETLARRAVGNLISNALRHTPRGGRIVLGAHPEGGATVLWVRDTGEGIPSHVQSRLGQPFQRGEQDKLITSKTGFGLGLAIVKGIMNLHTGNMQIDSNLGSGTTVFLTFPKPKSHSTWSV